MSYYKTELNIKFSEKDIAKQFGAQWDKAGYWYMFHFDAWDINYNRYNNRVSPYAFESLRNVNEIAKSLGKDIFDILPGRYKEKEELLSFILTDYVYCGPRSNIREDMCDCLYHPETYLSDLNKQLERALAPVTDYTNASNKEYLEEQKACARYCLEERIALYVGKNQSSEYELE